MAKMKVYELAQEIGVKSAEILALLKNKGIEVKSHMSVLEDRQVEDVRKTLKAPAKSEEAPKTTEKTTASGETKAPAKTGEGTTVKKKKSIIFVSNPHNSKMPGGAQIPRKAAHSDKKAAPPQGKVPSAGVKKPAAEPKVDAVSEKPVVTEPAKVEAVSIEQPKKEETVITPVTVKAPEAAEKSEASVKEPEAAAKSEAPVIKAEEAKPASKNDGRDNTNRGENQRRDGQRSFDNNKDNRNDGQRRDNNRNDGQRRDNNRNDGQRRDNNRNDGQRQGGRSGQGFNGGRDNKGGFGNKGAKGGFVPESPIKDAEKHRDEEKRRISQEKDKRNRKDLIYEEDSENIKNIKGKNKPGKFIKPEKKAQETVEEQIKVITLPESLTIKELADKMKIQPSAIVKKLFLQGQIVTVNQEIPYETAENIAIEYDIICEQEVKVDVIEELLKEEDENQEDMVPRSPVICVMGHVDHGKTSLLDAIRKTNVTDKEAGGITQHIGAYTVNVNGQKITFLDTPGHEAFTATDIAILVVAADDGVMPQTVEAINHAKAAGIEIIVAVNKIDKPGANIERVKQELAEYELIPEDWGGSTVFVPVSAKSGEGIEQLLEMILLTAEVLELRANPNRRARGLVIEAELDKGRGPVATILVQKGTLKVGDFVSAGAASGKVRAMVDDKGRRVK